MMAAKLRADWYADLLTRRDLDCYAAVRLVLRRLGVEMDADPMAESLKGSFQEVYASVRTGDVLVMESDEPGGTGQHLAVCLDAFNALHATGAGVRVDKVAGLLRTGKVERRLRARALIARQPGAGSGGGEEP